MIYRRLAGVLIALFIVFLTGVGGYAAIEGWSLFDALYMTVITISSVGYGEVHPLSGSGRLFTIVLILCGSATLIYGLSVLTAFIVEGELSDVIRRRKMRNAIARLNNHYIVCGVSSTGKYIIDELVKTGQSFVVVDKDHERIKMLTEANILNITGDATHDAVLEAANVAKAGGLFSAIDTDGDNLLVVVSARGLNPDLKIIAMAMDEESERKLRQVGADRVVMPSFIGGLRMASEMIRPSVVSFLDTMLRSRDITIRVEEIVIPHLSPLSGKTLADAGILDIEGVTVVAVSDGKGTYIFNPPRKRVIEPDDVIIVMGAVERILGVKALAAAA
jgi:voltage-gated potassium channel